MPTVFRHGGARYFFYSNEGSPREPPHVHVEQGDGEAKFWLRPEGRVASSFGFSSKALASFASVIEGRRGDIERAWHEYFG